MSWKRSSTPRKGRNEKPVLESLGVHCVSDEGGFEIYA